MAEELLIFKKFYSFVLLIYPVINRIPKSHRLVLGREIELVSLVILTSIIRANKTQCLIRKNIQGKISQNIDTLRILLRLTKDLKFMSVGQYSMLVEKLNEIAKMLYSWSR